MVCFALLLLSLTATLAAGQTAHVYTTVMVMDGSTMTMEMTSTAMDSAMSGMPMTSSAMDMSGMSMGTSSTVASSGLARPTNVPIPVGAVGLALAAIAGVGF